MDGDFELPTPPPLRYRAHEPVLTSSWTRVEQFSASSRSASHDDLVDDDEWEEEEVEYVTLDFGPHLAEHSLEQAESFQLLAAESTTPIVRIGNQYFQGTHQTSLGTDIILKPQPNPGDEQTVLQPFATTTSRIVFQPVSIDYAHHATDLGGSGTNGESQSGAANQPASKQARPGRNSAPRTSRGRGRVSAGGQAANGTDKATEAATSSVNTAQPPGENGAAAPTPVGT
ncbi:TFIIIC subunit 6 family protein [Sporobolomyces koalae]|uniref:TFIIIC subunit 6 family protein n=1 Tax=Sporobolomyces koalae TaxID=500713 RepID=UPI00317F3BD2